MYILVIDHNSYDMVNGMYFGDDADYKWMTPAECLNCHHQT